MITLLFPVPEPKALFSDETCIGKKLINNYYFSIDNVRLVQQVYNFSYSNLSLYSKVPQRMEPPTTLFVIT